MITAALGEVAEIERHGVDPRSLPSDTYYVGLEHIEPGGRIVGYDTVATARLTSTKFTFGPEHVLFGKLRPNLGKICRPLTSGVCSTDILPIRPGPRLDGGYLVHYLSQPRMVALASSHATGASLPRLSPRVLAEFLLPLPPLVQQRRMAAILDQADAVRDKWRAVISHFASLEQAVFHQMFADPGSRAVIAVAPLSDWVDSSRPITYGIVKPGPHTPDGVPYVRVVDMQRGAIELSALRRCAPAIAAAYRRSALQAGDLLMSIRGHVGRLALVPDSLSGANITQDSARLAVNDLNTAVYVRAAIEAPEAQRWMARRTKGVAVRGINLGDLRELPIPVVSTGAMATFAERSREIDAQIRKSRAALDASATLFASLQFHAFRGEL